MLSYYYFMLCYSYYTFHSVALEVIKGFLIKGFDEAHSRPAIVTLVLELLKPDSDLKNRNRVGRSNITLNIAGRSVGEIPGSSISRLSLEKGIPQTTLHYISHKDLSLKAFEVLVIQKVKPVDYLQHRVLVP